MKYLFHVLFCILFNSNWRIDYILIIVYSFRCLHRRFIKPSRPKGRLRNKIFHRKLCECGPKWVTVDQFDGYLWLVVSVNKTLQPFSRGWVFVWYDETTHFNIIPNIQNLKSTRVIFENSPLSWSTSLLDTMRIWENSI